MHHYIDLGNGHLQEIVGGEIPADAIESAEPIVYIQPVVVIPEPYAPTLAEAKEQRKEYIKWKRNEAESATPFIYDGSLFDYDPLSRERINSAVIGSTIAAVSGVPVSTVVATWRLYDNSERNMKVSDFLAFKQAEIARSGMCHDKATLLKADIDSATTVAEVNAIDW